MKKITFTLLTLLFAFALQGFGQGLEDFESPSLPSSYSNGSFTNNGITWTYVASRDDGNFIIEGAQSLMLRRSSSDSKVTSSAISGGIANFECKLLKAFTGGGNRQVELFINGVSKGTSIAWDNTDVQTFTVSDINIEGDIIIEIKSLTSKQVCVDNIVWTAYTSSTEFSCDFTADETTVELGTAIDFTSTILNSTGTVSYAWDFGDGNTSSIANPSHTYAAASTYTVELVATDGTSVTETKTDYITVTAPYVATLPFTENFVSELGVCQNIDIAGSNAWSNVSSAAKCNGYNGDDPEEHWLVLPDINLDNYADEVMTFTTEYSYGTIDANNFLELYYSTNFDGSDIAAATWTALTFTQASASNTSTGSGDIDLSAVAGTNVYIAFKYYSTNSPSGWIVDNISIIEQSTPPLSVDFTADATSVDFGTAITFTSTVDNAIGTVVYSWDFDNDGTEDSDLANPSYTYSATGTHTVSLSISDDADVDTELKADYITVTCPVIAAPVAADATDITGTTATANWALSTGATSYNLDVYSENGTPSPELVLNGGFETGDNSDWTKFESDYEVVISDNGVTPHSGSYFVKCFASTTRDLAQDITFTADGTTDYEVSFWYRYEATDSPEKLRCWSSFNTGDYAGDNISVSSYLDAVIEWTKVTYTITPNAGENTLHYELRTYGTGKAYIDDISFKIAGGGSIDYIIENEDMGTASTKAITGLTEGTAYKYRVRANNACSTTENSNVIEFTTTASLTRTDVQTACDSYTWMDGNTYTESNNIATHIIANTVGSDSLITLDLTINNSTSSTDIQISCDTYTWIDGNTYTASNNTVTHTIPNAVGCDSVITLDLTINNSTSSTDIQTACDTYTWIDDVTYTVSNNIATHTITNAAGCDSVITLNLTINNSTSSTDIQTACDTYTWIDDVTYTVSNNIATHTITNAAGCDSVITLDLTINNSTSSTDIQTACDTYNWIDGNTYTASNNTATHTITNAAGCDSVITLDLTINNSTSSTDIQISCDTYNWIDGNTYTASNNTATHTITNAAGCDSVITLNLTINNSTSSTDIQTACDTYTWIDDVTYTVSNNIATHTITNAAGCDSVITLDLTINNSTSSTDIQTACDTYTWIDDVTYTVSNNIATHTITNAAGCDSVITLNLTINPTPTRTDVQTTCDTYTWIDGNTYTASNNTATYTIANTAGCDSVITLDLTIYNSNTGTDFQTATDTYTWIDGVTYTESNNIATYTIPTTNGCDSVITLNLTINTSTSSIDFQTSCDSYTWTDGIIYTTNNNTATDTFVNTAGNDSIVTLDLTINYSTTTTDVQTACDSYIWIDDNTYTESNNTATYTLSTTNGCDSVITLDLTINNSTSSTDTQISCDTYTWIDDVTYTVSNNTATHTLTNAAGCDSVITLDLTINPTPTRTDVQTACDTYTWIDDVTYTVSNNIATHTIANAVGCDSVITLDLTINNATSSTDIQTACDTYTWIDDVTYTVSNNTATHTLTNATGCDSVITLNLTINNATSSTDIQTACDTYTWIDDVTYTVSNNTATHTLTNAAGCDSVITLDLTINPTPTRTDVQTACDTYTWIDDVIYTVSNNTATYTIPNAAGCDSVITLDLTINPTPTRTDVQTACDTYTWIDDVTYTVSNNTATHTIANAVGCDSVITLDLTINNTTSSTDIQTACDTYTWIDDVTYTVSNNTATHTLTNATGCDSVITLNLTINNATSSTDIQTACDTYTWIDDVTYTVSNNTATHTLTNAAGCDSVITLDLTINPTPTRTDVQTACDTYTWIDDVIYTVSNNTATHTIANAAGCDSVITLDLTINNSTSSTDIQTACDTYTWIDGITYTASNNTATHTIANTAGCDSVITLDLTINNSTSSTDIQTACDTYTWIDGNTYTASNNTAMHTIANAAGCDSVITLDLTINPSPIVSCPEDINITSNDIITLLGATPNGGEYTGVGVTNNQFDPTGLANGAYTITYTYIDPITLCEDFCEFEINKGTIGIKDLNSNISCSIYPNPTSDACTLNLSLEESQEVIIRLINNLGQEMEYRKLNSSKEFIETIDFSTMAPGVYSILIIMDGKQITKKVVLN